MKTSGFVFKPSTNFVFFLIPELMEEIETVVAEKKGCEYRNVSKSMALFGNSYYPDDNAKLKTTIFRKEYACTKKDFD